MRDAGLYEDIETFEKLVGHARQSAANGSVFRENYVDPGTDPAADVLLRPEIPVDAVSGAPSGGSINDERNERRLMR